MEAGNPKQVVVLSVVAVAAIGFLVTKIHRKDLPADAKAMVASATGRHHDSTSFPLVTDPFSHPKLAPQKDLTLQTTSSTDKGGAPIPAGLSGNLPFPGSSIPGNSLPAASITTMTGPIHPEDPGKTEAAGGKTPEGTEVVLEGTAESSDAVAFLAVGGAESQPFHVHDSIKGKVQLLSVADGSVVISGPKGKLTMNVGERKRI